ERRSSSPPDRCALLCPRRALSLPAPLLPNPLRGGANPAPLSPRGGAALCVGLRDDPAPDRPRRRLRAAGGAPRPHGPVAPGAARPALLDGGGERQLPPRHRQAGARRPQPDHLRRPHLAADRRRRARRRRRDRHRRRADRGLLRRQGRRGDHDRRRHPARLPVRAAGDRGGGGARGQPRRDHRRRRPQRLGNLRPDCAGAGPLLEGDRLHRGGPQRRRRRRPDRAPPYPAEHPLATDRRRLAGTGAPDHPRGDPLLPRPRPAAPDSELGRHDRRRPRIPRLGRGVVDLDLPRPRPLPDRPRHLPRRRLDSRRPRPDDAAWL
ncbi:MAG: ABC transporter, permease protein 2 (cluster 5, nickel/peptides/opines), partial [uncultured Thermomicrobiales bacterium]